MASKFTETDLKQYQEDGYLIVRGLYTPEEIALLRDTAKADKAMDEAASSRDDGEGHPVRLSLWNHPGDGVYGAFARGRRLVDSVETLLQDEAYHYHSKMVLKDAKVGGAWAWHQDYGYWYQNGVLYPNLCSVMIAADPATKANGCLQVLKGSHLLGRIEHVLAGDQAGADLGRVAEIEKRLEKVYVELEPGDAVFFHSNLLHCSDANLSDQSRWTLICCFNAKSNDPYKDSHHPRYTPLSKLDDDAILSSAGKGGAEFVDLDAEDESATTLSTTLQEA